MSQADRSGWRDARFDALADGWERAAGLAGVGGGDGLLGVEYDRAVPVMIVLYRPAALRATPAPLTARALTALQARARLSTRVCSYWPDAARPAFAPSRLDGTQLVDGAMWTERQWVGLLHAARTRPLPDTLDLADTAQKTRAADYQCRWVSIRHRSWGPDCPMVDVDRFVYDPATSQPVAIIDGKRAIGEDGTRLGEVHDRHLAAAGLHGEQPHPSHRVVARLADRTGIAAFTVLYSHQHDWVRVWPVGECASRVCEPGEGLTAAAWSDRLAGLAGQTPQPVVPPPPPAGTVWRAPDGTVCPPDPARPGRCACGLKFEGAHPFDCCPDGEKPNRAHWTVPAAGLGGRS